MKQMHTVRCKNQNCIGGRIETTMTGDEGYSNWTVMVDGELEIKCHGCGKFGTTDNYKKPNELNNFEIQCAGCGSHDYSYYPQDADKDGETSHIECKKCKAKTFELIKE